MKPMLNKRKYILRNLENFVEHAIVYLHDAWLLLRMRRCLTRASIGGRSGSGASLSPCVGANFMPFESLVPGTERVESLVPESDRAEEIESLFP